MSENHPNLSPVLYIPHGGGPLPLLGDPHHAEMIDFLQAITPMLGKPSTIVVISAHWEESMVTITSGANPPLIYDYFGFPEESYSIQYPAPGHPTLAEKIHVLLQNAGIEAKLDGNRGFDHGVFVPLKIMYPDAIIPCIQISLIRSLNPQTHINIGKALTELRKENVLILGSGFSFHNLSAFFSRSVEDIDEKNIAFEEWLIDTCINQQLSTEQRESHLAQWEQQAPYARYCHPREEHLLPLHVCYGMAQAPAKLIFSGRVMKKRASAYFW